jgi:integrase
MKGKLTKRRVDNLPAADLVMWDTELRGFAVRVKPSGAKSFTIQYRNAQGRSRRYTIGQYGKLTVEQARDEARQEFARIARGEDPAEKRAFDRDAMTVRELCEDYLDKAERGLLITRRGKTKKASTLYTDRGRIERHIIPRLGHRAVKDLTSADVRAFMRDVIAGKTKADVKTKPRGRAIVKGGRGTAARTMGLLGAILNYAVVELEVRPDNPARGITRPKDNKRVVMLDAARYRALGRALEQAEERGEPWQAVAAIRLIALTGARKGEIENLRWSEVDFAGRCLRLGESKTGASVRPLGSPALDLLREVKDTARGEYVLASRHAKPFKGLPRAWRRIVIGDAIADLTPHSLRHGFANTAEDEGLTVPTIAVLLGHAGHGVTAGYIHKLDSALIAAADKVSRRIRGFMTKDNEEEEASSDNVVSLMRA